MRGSTGSRWSMRFSLLQHEAVLGHHVAVYVSESWSTEKERERQKRNREERTEGDERHVCPASHTASLTLPPDNHRAIRHMEDTWKTHTATSVPPQRSRSHAYTNNSYSLVSVSQIVSVSKRCLHSNRVCAYSPCSSHTIHANRAHKTSRSAVLRGLRGSLAPFPSRVGGS